MEEGPSTEPGLSMALPAQLEHLAQLHKDGVLTQDEFDAAKAALIHVASTNHGRRFLGRLVQPLSVYFLYYVKLGSKIELFSTEQSHILGRLSILSENLVLSP